MHPVKKTHGLHACLLGSESGVRPRTRGRTRCGRRRGALGRRRRLCLRCGLGCRGRRTRCRRCGGGGGCRRYRDGCRCRCRWRCGRGCGCGCGCGCSSGERCNCDRELRRSARPFDGIADRVERRDRSRACDRRRRDRIRDAAHVVARHRDGVTGGVGSGRRHERHNGTEWPRGLCGDRGWNILEAWRRHVHGDGERHRGCLISCKVVRRARHVRRPGREECPVRRGARDDDFTRRVVRVGGRDGERHVRAERRPASRRRVGDDVARAGDHGRRGVGRTTSSSTVCGTWNRNEARRKQEAQHHPHGSHTTPTHPRSNRDRQSRLVGVRLTPERGTRIDKRGPLSTVRYRHRRELGKAVHASGMVVVPQALERGLEERVLALWGRVVGVEPRVLDRDGLMVVGRSPRHRGTSPGNDSHCSRHDGVVRPGRGAARARRSGGLCHRRRGPRARRQPPPLPSGTACR